MRCQNAKLFLRRPLAPKISAVVFLVHPVNGEVPPVKGRPWKLPHYANRGKTSSSGGELASARSCFSTVRTALGKLRITGLLARFDVARSFPQFPRPLLLQPTIWTSERGADLGSGRCQPRPHLPIYRMTRFFHSGLGSSFFPEEPINSGLAQVGPEPGSRCSLSQTSRSNWKEPSTSS